MNRMFSSTAITQKSPLQFFLCRELLTAYSITVDFSRISAGTILLLCILDTRPKHLSLLDFTILTFLTCILVIFQISSFIMCCNPEIQLFCGARTSPQSESLFRILSWFSNLLFLATVLVSPVTRIKHLLLDFQCQILAGFRCLSECWT